MYLASVLNVRRFSGFLLLALVIVCSASKCKEGAGNCDYRATVEDMSGLDGCGIMLVLEDGRKLLPSNLGQTLATVSAGTPVNISFKVLDGMASICMAEDHIVELTCFEKAGENALQPCPEMVDPFDPAWSMAVMKALEPYRVERLLIDNRVIYHYLGKEKQALYSCEGKLLCEYTDGDSSQCEPDLNTATDRRIIYVMDRTP